MKTATVTTDTPVSNYYSPDISVWTMGLTTILIYLLDHEFTHYKMDEGETESIKDSLERLDTANLKMREAMN